MPESHIAVGKSLPRIDGVDKVTGSAKYAADIRLDNMLHAKLLRSPHAHAKVKGIETSAAQKLPGVRAFATIFEVPISSPTTRDFSAFFAIIPRNSVYVLWP